MQSRHITLAINELFLKPVQKAGVKLDGSAPKKSRKRIKDPAVSKNTRPYPESKVENWTFDPLKNATNCPEESRVLHYQGDDRSFFNDRVSVRTIEAEEMSHTGTISFLDHVMKIQLELRDEQLKERRINIIGDLGTVVTIHGTEAQVRGLGASQFY